MDINICLFYCTFTTCILYNRCYNCNIGVYLVTAVEALTRTVVCTTHSLTSIRLAKCCVSFSEVWSLIPCRDRTIIWVTFCETASDIFSTVACVELLKGRFISVSIGWRCEPNWARMQWTISSRDDAFVYIFKCVHNDVRCLFCVLYGSLRLRASAALCSVR